MRIKVDVVVDVTGETCPVPLIEMRRALRKAQSGQILEIIGTHKSSRKEIPMAIKSLKETLLKIIDDTEGRWHIFIQKGDEK